MGLAQFAVQNRAVTYFVIALLVVGGVFSFLQLGQLEDPDFTVKTAVVATRYPGASAEEVELEVTDRLELAIQELPQLDTLYSISRAGISFITVDIEQEFWADRLPQVWDELRKKVSDVTPLLPPGCEQPDVMDDFAFVYGFVLAVTGDGFSPAELDAYADSLKKELSLVSGVARAELWGAPDKVVYVDVAPQQLAELGLTFEDVRLTLAQQNLVVDAGSLDVQRQRLRIAPTGEFDSVEEIGELVVSSTIAESFGNILRQDTPDDVIRIKDLGTVRAGYLEPPRWEMRLDGQPAIAIQIANVAGGNIVDTGRALDRRLNELIADLPVGIEVEKVAWQSDLVTESIDGFMVNLAEAILIVLVVLTIPMGWRMGVIIGFALIVTILGTFVVMAIMKIDLQRMSLGALVIALGMMVDNAIVVSDGILSRIQKGMDRTKAAIESAGNSAGPLLGATVVAVMAFYPIYASVADAGEYCASLFAVVAISLLLSWVVAVTVTPLQCIDMLRAPKEGAADVDPYGGRFYRGFRAFLAGCIRRRVLFVGAMVALLVSAGWGFGSVKQMFFPDASRNQIMIDYWAPEGTRIQSMSDELRGIEAKLLSHPLVDSVSTFVGQGPPRFYLPVDPELPYESYAELIVNTPTFKDVDALIAEVEPWMEASFPQAITRVRKYGVGPSDTWKFEARFSGPAEADLSVLRDLGEQGMAILRENPHAKEVRVDMRQRVKKLVPEYDQERGRWSAVSRSDIGSATRVAHDGLAVGLYREGTDLFPIVLRYPDEERQALTANLQTLPVRPTFATESVPLAQVTDDIRVEWEDPLIVRWNRRRANTVQCSPAGVTFPTLQAEVIDQFNAIELPPGYELFWKGEADSTATAQASLVPGCIPAGALILLIIVLLFNAYRPPLIILLAVPFALIGITAGLLGTDMPFGFLALLGAMSLAGMMIKNAIVLLDQIGGEIREGKDPYEAVVGSAISRLRPVALGAATTVLGVAPLLQDVFWESMAVTIMAGLTFGTVITMVLVPVLYTMLFRVPSPKQS